MSDTAKETPHGEAAFPLISEPGFPSHTGMSLRDYFAAKAMERCLDEFWGECNGAESAAAAAYEVADAMIAERNKRK